MKNAILILFLLCFTSCSLLTRASYNDDLGAVKRYVVREGADLNFRDRWGMTPLLWAAYYNHFSIAKYLVEKGADINVQAGNGYVTRGSTPILLASYYGHRAIVKLLLEKGADTSIKDSKGVSADDYSGQFAE